MKSHTISAPTRIAATLAIVAGVVTGAFWPAGPLAHVHASRTPVAEEANTTQRNDRIDPAIPALTIVARKLSAAEKRLTVQDMHEASEAGMLTASGAAADQARADGPF